MKNFERYSAQPPEYAGEAKIAPFINRSKLQIVEIDDSQVRYLEGRDVKATFNTKPRKPNNNLFTRFPIQTEGNYKNLALQADGIDVGYVMAGIYEEGKKSVGEIAMVRVSQSVMGLGVGSVLMNYGLAYLLDRGNVDTLRMEIADRSGKVGDFAENHQFRTVPAPIEIGMRRIVERPVPPDTAINLAEQACTSARVSLNKIAQNPVFWEGLSKVETDPPIEKLEELVQQGLYDANNRGPGPNNDVVYFGHPGGPVRVALVSPTGDRSTAIEVFIKGTTSTKIKELLGPGLNGYSLRNEDFGLGDRYRGAVLQGTIGSQEQALADLKPMIELSARLIPRLEAEKFVGG